MPAYVYYCPRWPSLRLGAIAFHGGIYETDDPEMIAAIERSDSYGVHIQRIEKGEAPEAVAEPQPATPDTPVSLDQPIEQRWAPRARQGTRGSR